MDYRGCCCTASIHFLGRRYFGSLLSVKSIRDRNFEYVEGILGVFSVLNMNSPL